MTVSLAFADQLWCAAGSPAAQAVLGIAGVTGLQQCWRAWAGSRRQDVPGAGKMTDWLRNERARVIGRRLVACIAAMIVLTLPLQAAIYLMTSGSRCADPLSDVARRAVLTWLGLLAVTAVLGAWVLILRTRSRSG